MLSKRAFPSRAHLRLVASRPENRIVRAAPEICRAIAETVAAQFRGLWVPSEMGAAGILELLGQHVVEVRGFSHPDDVEAIVGGAIEIIAETETAARAAFRRPPRRRRPRTARLDQLAFIFEDAA